jgi:hypothetical protein
MLRILARAMALVAVAVLSMTALGATPAQAETGPVPEEWGDVSVEIGQVGVVGRQNGRLPGRRGNQHLTYVNTWDEDAAIGGHVTDWWCPAGETAPLYSHEATRCSLKAEFTVEYDWPEALTHTWSPTLRYMNLRIPINLVNANSEVVRSGKVSLHVTATGALVNSWFEGDYLEVLGRDQATIVGGKFLGKPWLEMTSAELDYDALTLLRYYDGV